MPVELPSPTSNLRKRKPTGSDKFEQPQIKPVSIKTPAVTQKIERTPKQNQIQEIETAEFSSDRETNKMSMLRVLNKLLRHDRITDTDLIEFTQPDLEILKSIVKRKYKINIAQKDIDDKKSLAELLNQLDDKQKAVKRSEENNKLAFKRAIKFLINHYKKTHAAEVKDLKKKEYETLICREFFSGIALPEVKKRKAAQIDDFMPPMTPSGKNTKKTAGLNDEKLRRFVINPNTINAKYIKFVFGSKEFKSFFEDFIKNSFFEDYRRSRTSKLTKIIETVYGFFQKKGKNPQQMSNAKEYIEKNAKFKLPWTDKELKTCVDSTKSFIQRVNHRAHKQAEAEAQALLKKSRS